MNISIPSRFFRAVFSALVLLLLCSSSSNAQPKGKWHAGPPLPSLNQTGRTLFFDSLLGYYIGQDKGFVTKNGGLSWTAMNFPDNARPFPTYLFAPDHSTIMSFQSHNIDTDGVTYPGIIKSTDMGATWTLVSSVWLPGKIAVFTMWSVSDGFRIWLNDNTQKPVIAATHDGGLTWTDTRGDATLSKYIKLTGSSSLALYDSWSDSVHGAISVSLPGSLQPTASTAYPVLVTSDGGRTWKETFPSYNGSTLYQHSFVSLYPGSQTIWTVPSLAQYAEYFFYSTDFGSTWKNSNRFKRGDLGTFGMPAIVKFEPVSASSAWAIAASDSEHPYITRSLIAYNDIPNGWTLSTSFPKGTQNGHSYYWDISGIQFTDPDHGYIPVQKYVDTSTGVSQPAVPVDTVVIYRYYLNAPGAVLPASNIPSLRCTPNPASSLINITGLTSDERVLEIKLMNTLGKESSFTPRISGSDIELDMSSYPSGSYYVYVKTSMRQESIPVMVVR